MCRVQSGQVHPAWRSPGADICVECHPGLSLGWAGPGPSVSAAPLQFNSGMMSG